MPHGAPDDSNVVKLLTVHRLDDMAELAVRLGSPVTFDRRGDVIWWAIFQYGMEGMFPVEGVSGDEVALSVRYPRQGPYCLKLTNNNITNSRCSVQKFVAYPTATGIGFECSFSVADDVDNIRFSLAGNDGSRSHYARIRYDHQNTRLQYLDEDNAYQTFATGLVLQVSDIVEHTIKMVIDFAEEEYVRCILDDDVHSLAGIPYRTLAGIENQYWTAAIRLFAVADGTESIFIDSLIVTQNEP